MSNYLLYRKLFAILRRQQFFLQRGNIRLKLYVLQLVLALQIFCNSRLATPLSPYYHPVSSIVGNLVD